MKTILLKFSSPLQSWGTSSNFETRETDHHPSKSAVVGLIAGSMGLSREDKKITDLNELLFAVRVDDQGNLKRDYHIAKKYKKMEDLTEIMSLIDIIWRMQYLLWLCRILIINLWMIYIKLFNILVISHF
ncbi:type I-E CRISPR-associated protein Cas5/CasD [Dolosigranulum pigrum]|uniref:type I-E CRISPR-associated protein Cas5/CasD n=1 Tax=Dolosigranulum pigrum TaxID=29394 RepID=UPI00244E376E|nr:type I-E CRISPR-associated protein Cas5/CasD [Dolosigranulum pigrum]